MEYLITSTFSLIISLLISFIVGKFYYSFNSYKIKEDYKRKSSPTIITRKIQSMHDVQNIPEAMISCKNQYFINVTNPLSKKDNEYNEKSKNSENLLIEFIPIELNEISFNEQKLFLLIDNTKKSASQLKAYVNKGERFSLLNFKENFIESDSRVLLIFDMHLRPQQIIIDIGEFEATYEINLSNEISCNAILKRKKTIKQKK